ncbi:hypothetical protein [Streptomyces sp. NPDC052107]|uniref:hypothetical protein n=1 Tax=Streptomyces sp. NPDC052107 TaxID=3155632 RepID=UPI00341793FA
MRSHHRLRRLALPDGTVYRWSVRHEHADGCREVLGLYRDGGYTRIVFREGEAGSAADGHWYAGCVADGRGNLLGLREPRVVRALVDEAERRGLLPGRGELDRWDLFHAAVAAVEATETAKAAEATAVSRATAATAGVRPGCPPGP